MGLLVAQPTVTPPAPAATEWVGIPDPATVLGYSPITVTEPADPGAWPSGESSGNYYIDAAHGSATDTANTYGYPDKPRLTIPTSMNISGGSKCVVVGDGNSYSGSNITLTSTAASAAAGNQAWFIGRSATDITIKTNRPILDDRRLIINDTYIVASDFKIEKQDPNNSIVRSNGFSGIRNFELEGTGAEVNQSGSCVSLPSNSVAYNGEIHEMGKWDTNNNADYHACKSGAGTKSNIWYLDILAYHVQGDTIQIGDASGDPATLHHIYLGNIRGYDNKENVIDTKDCSDVIISGGWGYGMSGTWGDDEGADVTIHDESTRVWVINRLSYDCSRGVAVSGDASDTYILNSVFRDFTNTSGTAFYDPGTAIQARSGRVDVVGCTFHNCRKAIEFPVGSSTAKVQNNIIHARAEVGADDFDIAFENSSDASGSTIDHNMYDDVLGCKNRIGGTVYTSLSAWQSATVHDDNSSEADPLFTDEAGDDFTLQAGSPAIDAGDTTLPDAYSDFETLYGINIETDLNGDPRPAAATDFDLGAFERQ